MVKVKSIYAGIPTKKVKTLDEANTNEIQQIANNYVKYSSWYEGE